MTRKNKHNVKRLVAFILIMTMAIPHVAFAAESPGDDLLEAGLSGYYPDTFHEDILTMDVPPAAFDPWLPWYNLPEIEPLNHSLGTFSGEIDFADLRLKTLLERMHEFDSLTAEEQAILAEYLDMDIDDPLAERSPEEVEEFLRAYEIYLSQNLYMRSVEEDYFELENFYIQNLEEDYFGIEDLYIHDVEEAYLEPAEQMFSPLDVPTSAHQNIIVRPFDLHFNEEDSVCLNTGASQFRINILSLPGRGGFGLKRQGLRL